MKGTLYIKAEQNIRVTSPDVMLSDLGEVWCSDSAVLARCRALRLTRMKGHREVLSIVDVVRTVEEAYPDVSVNNLGESDFVLEYKAQEKTPVVREWVKFALIWLVIFFGAGFAIATFNEDVSVKEIFSEIHQSVSGREVSGCSWLEGGYAVGLAGGILVFYNHFSKRKETSDPTPLEVEMRTYEKELYTTMIDNAGRQGGKDGLPGGGG